MQPVMIGIGASLVWSLDDLASDPDHESIERIGLQRGSYHLITGFHANTQFLTKVILHYNNGIPVGVSERQQVLVALQAECIQTLCARLNNVVEVLYQIVPAVVIEHFRRLSTVDGEFCAHPIGLRHPVSGRYSSGGKRLHHCSESPFINVQA